ncbi:helix-turn-helix domain-containing protein [Streptomyces sp. NPDC091215]|uniref:helix-turn-helix domain-containing protein n=3 Tax=unclassified Streptomyces TaxID=2593676 RepID=UPI0034207D93
MTSEPPQGNIHFCKLSQADEPDEWEKVTERYFGSNQVRLTSAQAAHASFRRVGAGVMADMWLPPCEVKRARAQVSARRMPLWKVNCVLSGTAWVEQEHRAHSIGPGDMTICDMERESRLIVPTGARLASLTIPKAVPSLATLSASEARLVAGRRIEGKPGVLNALISLMSSVSAGLAEFDERSLVDVNKAITLLLCAAFRENLGGEPKKAETNEELLASVRMFIAHNIADPDLGPGFIAESFNISVRKLYRLFEGTEAGLGQEIRIQRIRGCAEDLRNPLLRHETVSTIGFRWGLRDASAFSRNFKSVFGMSPREYRNTFCK